jgi:hypothetical protein
MSRYLRYQDLITEKRSKKMTKTMLKVLLAAALFCGTAMAYGNMGGSGYTGCYGNNPPPTCECNVPEPPATCNTGGFAANTSNYESADVDLTIMVAELLQTVIAVF